MDTPKLDLQSRLGMGCMRLSTDAARDDAHAVALLHAAIENGITFFDTANAYCHDNADLGHNERLIARALETWNGDTSSIVVATKGGLTRPSGRWVPDGRAKGLRAACEASRNALGVERIDLYQLHAVDPKTPFLTSIRALASLQRDGLVAHIGLCNVSLAQIQAAQDFIEIASVQIELNLLNEEYFRNGVVEFCRDERIPIIAARPLAGKRITQLHKHDGIAEVVKRHHVTPEEIALAWLIDLSDVVVPIPGATSFTSITSLTQVSDISLTDKDREIMDAHVPAGRLLRTPREIRRPKTLRQGDVVVIMGSPGAGKTTVASEFVAKGYRRLNRDDLGGSLHDLVPKLGDGLAGGSLHWVLDNTYPTRAARNHVIETAWLHNIPVRCVWLNSEPDDVQWNVVTRMVNRLGYLPDPDDIKALSKSDPTVFGPDALFRYERNLDAPAVEEGFETVEVRTVHRIAMPSDRRAIFIDIDALTPHHNYSTVKERLLRFLAESWLILGFAWRPEIETHGADPKTVDQQFTALKTSLGIDFDVAYCPHRAGPPKCWCRIPLPGLIVQLCQKHSVDPTMSYLVGNSAADKTLARKTKTEYLDWQRWLHHPCDPGSPL